MDGPVSQSEGMMKLEPKIVAAVLTAFVGNAVAGIPSGDAERGRSVYQANCVACHSLDYNSVGPAHRGVFGRPIGKAPGYAYSSALQTATGNWTAENLERWLADPEKFLSGQRMGFSLDDPQDRADVIEYLKSVSPRE
jgi:cytochrome c